MKQVLVKLIKHYLNSLLNDILQIIFLSNKNIIFS